MSEDENNKRKKVTTKVKPHKRSNPKSPGKHQVSGHRREIGKKTQVREHWREYGGSRNVDEVSESLEAFGLPREEVDENFIEVINNQYSGGYSPADGVEIKATKDEIRIVQHEPVEKISNWELEELIEKADEDYKTAEHVGEYDEARVFAWIHDNLLKLKKEGRLKKTDTTMNEAFREETGEFKPRRSNRLR